MNKYLIVGLGNPGIEYDNTRHNIGFKVVDAFASKFNAKFSPNRLADTVEIKIKNKIFILIKPTTYMNLSGKSVNYYLQTEKVPLQNLLVITDDLALPVDALRLRGKGSDGGHNGLKSINEVLGTENYARLRFGIGNDFPKGGQVHYVLGKWSNSEISSILIKSELVAELVKDFAFIGLEKTMSAYNSKI